MKRERTHIDIQERKLDTESCILLGMKKIVLALPLLLVAPVLYAATATDVDKTFVSKVSQGGAYEVAASRLAGTRAHAQDVKDLASMEVHDHALVGVKLKKISAAARVAISPVLNPEFSERLAKLKTVPAVDFDSAYLADMKQIHDNDEKLFAQEAIDGSGAFKTFAAETDLIVKRHIGALNGVNP